MLQSFQHSASFRFHKNCKALKLIILFASLLIQNTFAQSQCFSIAGSKMCQSLAGMNVKLSPGSFNDVNSFDNYVASQLQNSSSYVSQVRSFYDCPNWTGNFERYHLSTICAFLVQKSGCQQPAPTAPLCKESCSTFIKSSADIFADATACNPNPAASIQTRRNDLVNNASNDYISFCNELLPKSQEPNCSDGEPLEAGLCGFFSKDDAMEKCTGDMANDPCCPSLVNGVLREAADGLNPPNNLFLIVGIVIGIILFLIVLFFLYIRGKKWSKESTDAMPIPAPTISRDIDGNKKLSVFQTISAGAQSVRKSIVSRKSRNFESMYSTPGGTNSVSPSKFKKIDVGGKDEQRPRPPLESVYTEFNASGVESAAPTNRATGVLPEASKENPIRMVVIDTYSAGLDDEIDLKVDDILLAEEVFDDGWGLAKNLTTGSSGAFPLACVLPMDSSNRDTMIDGGKRNTVISSRTSSLYNPAGIPKIS